MGHPLFSPPSDTGGRGGGPPFLHTQSEKTLAKISIFYLIFFCIIPIMNYLWFPIRNKKTQKLKL